jgi:methyl-accepting chemotaxis protein
MNFFRNLSVKFKILLIPTLGSIGFVFYLIFNTVTMNSAVELLDNAQKVRFPLLQTAEKSLVILEKIKETLASAATMGEPELLQDADNMANQMKEGLNKALRVDQQTAMSIQKIQKQFDSYYNKAQTISAEMVEGTADFSTLGTRSKAMSDELLELQNSLNNFQTAQMSSFTSAFEQVNSKVNTTTSIGITVGIITIVLLFGVALTISNAICSNLIKVVSSFKGLAKEDGDLTVRIESNSKDEIGELTFWFNSFMDKLQHVIKQIVDTAKPLSNTASTMNELSVSSKESAEQQKETVSHSLMSVNEMSQSVASITSNAADAAEAAKHANNEAELGLQVVNSTITGIRELAENIADSAESIFKLQEDTNQVNQVLEVIKSIAEQTNLLALNAAIEAARAGEQGRGFAVVADEVRTLASRTQASTQEINQILVQLQSAAQSAVSKMENSKNQVEGTVDSANKAGESLSTITETVNVISDMNSQIAVATEEQHKISTLMVEHVETIQQRAEEASIASDEMNAVSNNLSNLAFEQEKITKSFKV